MNLKIYTDEQLLPWLLYSEQTCELGMEYFMINLFMLL